MSSRCLHSNETVENIVKTEKSSFNKTANAAYDSHLSKQDFRNMASNGIDCSLKQHHLS